MCGLWNYSNNIVHDIHGNGEWKIVTLKGQISISEHQS